MASRQEQPTSSTGKKVSIRFFMTTEERKKIRAAAGYMDQDMAAFVRSVVLKESQRVLDENERGAKRK